MASFNLVHFQIMRWFHRDLLSDDGKTPPPGGALRQSMKYDSDVIYLPFTSTSGDGGSVGICHTNKSLVLLISKVIPDAD